MLGITRANLHGQAWVFTALLGLVRQEVERTPARTRHLPQMQHIPRHRLLADVSLWSADLANLERDLAVASLADSFHFDVADAHFAPSLLFFPDLVRRLRFFTTVPFHIHLMVDRPVAVLDDFLAAGAVSVDISESWLRDAP